MAMTGNFIFSTKYGKKALNLPKKPIYSGAVSKLSSAS
jgi:hypothetical protein